jgi:aminoglycoside phosphotransferase family enzyme/predicted kinase
MERSRPDSAPALDFDTRELRETHLSWVFLGEHDVYKIKKPLDLGFVDFRTLEARRVACDAEVRLNRRLAPGDVYRGSVPLYRVAAGRLSRTGTGEPVEWAVHMRRLPDSDRGDVLLRHGELRVEHVDAVATRIAQFHEASRRDAETAAYGRPERIAHNVQENFHQAGDLPFELVGLQSALEIEVRQLEFLRAYPERFLDRMRAGHVRDGHGDLRLEHVYLAAGAEPIVLDCIEFADRFRFADTCADVAFLSMDLGRLGRTDLAERFLARYARDANDFDLYRLVDFYEGYRAYVRAKIACLRILQMGPNRVIEREARTCFLLALATGRPPLAPAVVVAVGGLPGSGKTTVADKVSFELGCPVIDADRTRKHLLGVAPTASLRSAAWQGAYEPAVSERVYGEMMRRAEAVVESGRSVVLDASFRSVALRTFARDLARCHGLPLRFVECAAPAEVCRARLAARDATVSVSDAGVSEYEAIARSYEPPMELDESERIRVDTSRPLSESIAVVRERLAS